MSLHRLSESIPADPEFVDSLVAYLDTLTDTERDVFKDGTYDATLALATKCDAAREKKSKAPHWPHLYSEAVKGLKSYFALIHGAITARPELASLAWGGLMFAIEMISEHSLYFTKIGSILKLLADDLTYYGVNADLIYRNWDLVCEALSDVYGDFIMLCTTVFRTFNHKGGRKRTRIATTKTALNPFSTRFLLVYGDLHLRRQTIEPQLKVEEVPYLVSSRRSRRGTNASSHGSYVAYSPSEAGRFERSYSATSSGIPRQHEGQYSPSKRSPIKSDVEGSPTFKLSKPPQRRHGSSNTTQGSGQLDADLTPTNTRRHEPIEIRGRSPTTRGSMRVSS